MFVKSCDELLALLKDEFPPLEPLENEAWKSSTVLSDDDQSRLIIIREQCNQAMLNLTTQIAEMKKCITALEQLKLHQEPRLQNLDSALAPWRRLPPEALSRIFEIYSEDSVYCISLPLPLQHVQPRNPLPEHVCNFWQQVALRTPALYENIGISYHKYSQNGVETRDELTLFASQVLARGTRQLSIDFDEMGTENCDQCLAQLDVKRNQRIESLDLVHRNAQRDFVDSLADLLQQSPNLKEFRFRGCAPYTFYLLEDIPHNYWTGLSTLSISGGYYATYLTVDTTHYLLARCPALRVCRLSIGDRDVSDHGASTQHQPLADGLMVKLSCLQHLEVTFLELPRIDGPRLLRPLMLPSLQKLMIRAEGGLSPSHIRSLLERSQCSLRLLNLTEHQTRNEATLMELLPALPTIQSLLMPRTFFSPSILGRIASGEYLPELEHFEMYIDKSFSTLDAILALADARWDKPNGGNIHHIRCRHHPSASPSNRSSSWPFSPEVAMKFESQNREIEFAAWDYTYH